MKNISKKIISIIPIFLITITLCAIKSEAADYSSWIAIFDPVYYAAHSEGARAYAGNDQDKLWQYFVNVGIPKGEQACEEFNVYIYAKNYPELVKQYGGQMMLYYVDYVKTGKAAGRNARTVIGTQANNTTTTATSVSPDSYPLIIINNNSKQLIGVNDIFTSKQNKPGLAIFTYDMPSSNAAYSVYYETSRNRFTADFYNNDHYLDAPNNGANGICDSYTIGTINTPFGPAKVSKFAQILPFLNGPSYCCGYEAIIKIGDDYVAFTYSDIYKPLGKKYNNCLNAYNACKDTIWAGFDPKNAKYAAFTGLINATFAK